MEKEIFKTMFREYDVRGRVSDDELNIDTVKLITKGFITFLTRRNVNRVVLGYDNRDYSESFSTAALEEFIKSGFEVYDLGMTISPVAYFAQYYYKAPGVMMITASHNPNGWSGFKLGDSYSKTMVPDEITELYDIILGEEFSEDNIKIGVHNKVSPRDAYIDYVISNITMSDYKPRLVIDAGNGGAGLYAYEVFQRLGCITFQLNCDPDSSYPHYFPNPSDLKARERLAQMVRNRDISAAVGLSFDGDGDRLGVIDQNGQNIWSDRVLLLLARQLLERKKGAKIVFDVKCTQALVEDIETHSGQPIMWKTGHSYIKSKMHEEKAELAGERSGHIFIGGDEFYSFDDAILAGAKLVEYLSKVNRPIADILMEAPQYITSPEIKVHCSDTLKYGLVESIVKEFKDEYGDKVIDINGARVMFDDGWGLIRASSNLPELVLIFEAKTWKQLLKIRQIFKEKLTRFPMASDEWINDIE
ncbi:phosphomannomutase/phosphoglucomutase [Desulfosporosinus sp. BICA1-9]|uniref:phosphomannomutase/phosphoglucomutase n=1 Tax=Desulfosporosinus sp. BICA1-9 TaxID=1531958 RepID=UPI00054BC995|nr:phosphomannomutase/phosphoglucomutase [Desulfosporosinus sp. BICA1-9]KJS50903.1 MAG: phosphomannomutase [Peptococcaceae bacterium BRH_c23]KJS88020.1 MAG: phosphomannomutase [Desulfosporosinus sp. BICA1-9]HBW37299.1 phosphomannomutase/phosphoglucomutase [Desulfosporosinus sp.]